MKKKILAVGFSIGMVLAVMSACGKEESGLGKPDTLMEESVKNTDTAYEWKALPWGTPKEEAGKSMGSYTLDTEKENLSVYWKDGTLKDGTPVREQVYMGYQQMEGEMGLSGLQIVYYMEKEKSDSARTLFEEWKKQMEPWKDGEDTRAEWEENRVVLSKEDNGSSLLIQYNPYNPNIVVERADELLPWDMYCSVTAEIWSPREEKAEQKGSTLTDVQSFTDLLDALIRAENGDYYPAQVTFGETTIADLTQERGRGISYTSGAFLQDLEWADNNLYYEEEYPGKEGKVIQSYYYGDSAEGDTSPAIVQARYRIPFEDEEECQNGCEAFLEWIQAADPRTSEWKVEDLFFKGSGQTPLNREEGISGSQSKIMLQFGVVWTTDDGQNTPLENPYFSIMLLPGSY